MTTYSMAQIASLSGISAHTLRIWERRYSFLSPKRSDTNIRYYSDDELRKLINIGILTRNGYRISQIDQMSDEAIEALIIEQMSDPSQENADEISGLTVSMLNMDEEAFNRIYQRNVVRKGLLATMMDVIYPFLNQVGILWIGNKAIPAQEHFISNLIRQKVIASIESIPSPSKDAPKIILYLLEYENHELGLLLASFIAKDLGWRVIYLGQNVPLRNVGETLSATNADLALTMFIVVNPDKVAGQLKMLGADTDIPLLVTGHEDNFAGLPTSDKVIHIKDPRKLSDYLLEWNAQKTKNSSRKVLMKAE